MAFKCPSHTQTPNEFFDDIAKTLKEGELRVLLCIMRQTFGWRKKWDRISLSQLMRKTGMERKAVSNSLKSLIEKKLIEKRKTGENGNEKCWYSLIMEGEEDDPEDPNDGIENEQDTGVISNNSYQYPKDTPPSILKIPTKETNTKEKKEKNNKKDATSAGAFALCDFFLRELKKRKENITKTITPSWLKIADKLLKLRTPDEIAKITLFAFDHEFWCKNVLSPEKLLKHLDALEIEMVKPKTSNASSGSPVTRLEQNRILAESIAKRFPLQVKSSDVCVGPDYLEFRLGFNHPGVHIKFTDNGFKEQAINGLRKMRLPVEGL